MTLHDPKSDPLSDFLAQRTFAVVGVSRDPSKWGTVVYRDLKAKGYRVFPVNPKMSELGGDAVFPSLAALPEPVDGVVIVTPPAVTEQVVREAHGAGISRVWMQEGAESETALQLCEELGIAAVHGVCVIIRSR